MPPSVAGNDNGDNVTVFGQAVDDGDNDDDVGENVATDDDGDEGVVGDDVPDFLLSRGRDPFVLILYIKIYIIL